MPAASPRPRRWLVPAVLTALILLARLAPAPPLSDPTGAPLPPGLRLRVPLLHAFLAPLFDAWDAVSMLPLSRLTALFAALPAYYVAWRLVARVRRSRAAERPAGRRRARRVRPAVREVLLALTSVALLAAFVVVGAVWHRPMIALAGVPEDMMVADFHSHTSASHDVRNTLMRGYDAEAMRRWHRRAGFDAAFVTDHNTVAGFPRAWAGPTWLCPGIEVSAWRAHVVLLGNTSAVERGPYSASYEGLLSLLAESERRHGALAILSIPEYERNHWRNLPDLAAAGADGFEIVNASPKANELARARRDSVIALARARDLLVVGVSDSHGWGATSMAWNLVRVPGWRASGVGACERLLAALRDGGIGTVRVVERHRLRRDAWWPRWLTPAAVPWEIWRTLDGARLAGWLGWVWLLPLLPGLLTPRPGPSRGGGGA